MCVSKVQHMTGRKTGCNRSRPVFFGFSIFRQTSQLATEKIQNLCNRNWWSGLLRLGSVRFRSFFQSSELDLRTLLRFLKTFKHFQERQALRTPYYSTHALMPLSTRCLDNAHTYTLSHNSHTLSTQFIFPLSQSTHFFLFHSFQGRQPVLCFL